MPELFHWAPGLFHKGALFLGDDHHWSSLGEGRWEKAPVLTFLVMSILSSSLKLNAVPWDGAGAGSTDMHHAK